MRPSPYANFIMDDIEFKIVEASISEEDSKDTPGTIFHEDKKYFLISTKDKAIKITKIKPVGKNVMCVSDFKNGYHSSLVGKALK